jgi:hypothetical protein
VPVSAEEKIAVTETSVVKVKGSKGKLASIRKKFVGVFSREQKKQRRLEASDAGTRAVKPLCNKTPTARFRGDAKARKALGVKKRWSWRSPPASHVHEARGGGSSNAFEASFKKP